MADGLNNSWLFIFGITGCVMMSTSALVYGMANKYKRAQRDIMK